MMTKDEMQAWCDQWMQERWNEGAAACMGLIRMAEAIRNRREATMPCLECGVFVVAWRKFCDECEP